MRVGMDFRGGSLTAASGTHVYFSALAEALEDLGVSVMRMFQEIPASGLSSSLRSPRSAAGALNGICQRAAYYRDAEQKIDLFATPHLNYFEGNKALRVVHVQDLAFQKVGGYSAIKRHFWSMSLNRTLKRFDKIIAISSSTANDITNTYNVPRSKMSVIPHGLDSRFRLAPLTEKTRTEAPMFLHIGAHHPRKRIPDAIKIFKSIKTREPASRMVIAGPFAADTATIEQTINDLDLAGTVDLRGPVSDQDLDQLYRQATGLIWTSAYEGFGLPLREAMALGVPLFSVTNSSVPEVTGGHYQEIDTHLPEQSAEAILACLADQDRLNAQLTKARTLARSRSWKDVATETLAVWEQAILERKS
ncbi:MAG: glycosyltransferase family 1 protein [Pseudomonadota bacterium]